MELRELNVRPHVARHSNGRRSAIDGAPPASRLCDEPAQPQADRGGVRLDQDGGRPQEDPVLRAGTVDLAFTFAAGAYNLVRLPRLLAGALP